MSVLRFLLAPRFNLIDCVAIGLTTIGIYAGYWALAIIAFAIVAALSSAASYFIGGAQ